MTKWRSHKKQTNKKTRSCDKFKSQSSADFLCGLSVSSVLSLVINQLKVVIAQAFPNYATKTGIL